jgi:hypothetical protein
MDASSAPGSVRTLCSLAAHLTDEGGAALSGVIPSMPTLVTGRLTGHACVPVLLQHKVGPAGATVMIDPSERVLSGRRARLGLRAAARHPGAVASIDATAEVRQVLRGTRRVAVPRCAGRRVRPSASQRCGDAAGGKQSGSWRWLLRLWVADLYAPCSERIHRLRPAPAVLCRLVGTCGSTSRPSTGCSALGYVRGRSTSRRQPHAVRVQHPADKKGPCDDNQYR